MPWSHCLQRTGTLKSGSVDGSGKVPWRGRRCNARRPPRPPLARPRLTIGRPLGHWSGGTGGVARRRTPPDQLVGRPHVYAAIVAPDGLQVCRRGAGRCAVLAPPMARVTFTLVFRTICGDRSSGCASVRWYGGLAAKRCGGARSPHASRTRIQAAMMRRTISSAKPDARPTRPRQTGPLAWASMACASLPMRASRSSFVNVASLATSLATFGPGAFAAGEGSRGVSAPSSTLLDAKSCFDSRRLHVFSGSYGLCVRATCRVASLLIDVARSWVSGPMSCGPAESEARIFP